VTLDVLTLVVATAAGAIASVTGFGIGSLLTPVLALRVETHLAVAAVGIPHVVGTAVRFALLKDDTDRPVLWTFGVTSAAGGLAGAFLYTAASSRSLNVVFGLLLLFAAAGEMTGLTKHMRFRGWLALTAGALSGFLGGLVGNQGGIRSAALLGFGLPKQAFVATATAIALFVDGARLPIYLASESTELLSLGRWIVVATVGVTIGTLLGNRTLARLDERIFRGVLAVIIGALGVAMLVRT
jgi:uncharacterized membrane protein YfcA